MFVYNCTLVGRKAKIHMVKDALGKSSEAKQGRHFQLFLDLGVFHSDEIG